MQLRKNKEKIKDRFTPAEKRLFKSLNSPAKIQDFLETLKINFEERGETCMSPRRVMETKKAHCMEGAMFAAAALEFQGHPPLVMDLRAVKHDFDHVVAPFKLRGHWGAISKTNHAVLRYREPVYNTLRELALSYFHEYFMDDGKKTLREYSKPMNLKRFDRLNWRTVAEDLWDIPDALDEARHFRIVSPAQVKQLRQADVLEIAAGKLTEWKLVKNKSIKNRF